MSTRLTFQDVLEHRADCHFFLKNNLDDFVTEKEIQTNEDMAIRFTRTFGSEGQLFSVLNIITKLRLKRAK